MTQQCSACQHISPDAAKFCLECGTPLLRTCAQCGHPTGGGKFCMECGAPVQAAAHPGAARPTATYAPNGSQQPVSERRTTTVLFGDLVSFTSLSEDRDPEEVRELLSAYFAVARTVVARYGGTIEKFIGDALMAVWGVPVSHEDDAERAVRAGLDLVSEVAALGASVDAPDLALRVGIVTGSVAVTLGAVGEGMVAGDAVNTAARVQATAEPGTVWVDHETRGLAAAAVAFDDRGEHELKGKSEPVRLFRAGAVVAAVGGAQRVDGLEAPMIGRDGELRQLKELFHRTQDDRRARIVVVTGTPGVGKSRLGWEFEKYTDGLQDTMWWHRGRCLSYGDGVAYWAFGEMIRSRLGLQEGDDRGQVAAKLRAGVAALAADDRESEWLVSRLATLLGVGDGSTFDRTDLYAAWTTFLQRVGGDEPVVLVFEDMHQADTSLLELVEHLLETFRGTLFVLVLARPELLDQRPSLVAGRRATVVELAPLAQDRMTSLVDALVGDLPAAVRSAVVTRAEGIPLYAVETVRSLIDREVVVAHDGRYVFVDHDPGRLDLEQLAAPTSLQTLISARLDALSPLERRTVQDASVLGLTFQHAGLMALSEVGGYELDQALSMLVRKGILTAETDPRSPEQGQFRFLQALVREVAYGTLARADRRTRHLAAATYLEDEHQVDEAVGAVAGIVAQHLVDAMAATPARDPGRPDLADRARALLVAAATRAESLGSPEEALRSTLQALDLAPGPDEDAELCERAARVAVASGSPLLGEELAGRALAGYRSARREADLIGVLVVLAGALFNQGRLQDAADCAAEGLALVERHPEADPVAEIKLLGLVVDHARSVRDTDQQARLALQMVRRADEVQDPEMMARALNSLAITLADAGSPTAHNAVLSKAVAIAREGHLLLELGRSLINLLCETYPHDLAEAATLGKETVDTCRQTGHRPHMEIALVNVGFTWWFSGDWDRVVEETTGWFETREVNARSSSLWLSRALVGSARGETAAPPGFPESENVDDATATALVDSLATAAHDPRGAARRAAQAIEAMFGHGEMFDDFEIFWGPTLELQLAAGDLDAAQRVLDLGAPLVGGRARPLSHAEHVRLTGLLAAARGGDPEADFRAAERAHAAYGAPYLLARTRLELGRWLVGQGRGDEATVMLAQARETFVALGAAPSLAELDELEPVLAVMSL